MSDDRPTMTTLRIKIKIGENEFEADGPPEEVQAQVRMFARLMGREETLKPTPAPVVESIPKPPPPPPPPPAIKSVALADGKLVSLPKGCESLDHAVLALLLGHRELRRQSFGQRNRDHGWIARLRARCRTRGSHSETSCSRGKCCDWRKAPHETISPDHGRPHQSPGDRAVSCRVGRAVKQARIASELA
jgi:hypothetical protein